MSTVAITGARTYSGRYISRVLQKTAVPVNEIRNLTQHPDRKLGQQMKNNIPISTHILDWESQKDTPLEFKKNLVQSLEGVDTFYCTYWMRYHNNYDIHAVSPALHRVQILIDAAKEAGVKRIVYISHTKAQDPAGRNIAYIKAKAQAENYIAQKNFSNGYAFIRPCCLFGESPNESIVVNNTAYLVRRLPMMVFPGDMHKLYFQPVHAQDLAEMAVAAGESDEKSIIRDAVGPELLTFYQFMSLIKQATNSNCILKSSSMIGPGLAYQFLRPINYGLQDVYVDEGDLRILCANLACSDIVDVEEGQKVWGRLKFSDWIEKNGRDLGNDYINSYIRYYDRK